jgi:acylphosphatase
MACRHFLVSGQVQGVFYRASTQQEAQRIGLFGWVRNMTGGQVELVACGTAEQLATLETWLNHGPPMARVDSVKTSSEPSEAVIHGFKIRY